MSPHEWWIVAGQLAMGFALAATCGLRAFLPLFVTSLLSRLGYVPMSPAFAWMGSTPALIVFGSALVFEIAGDKVPLVNHALDAAGVVVKPLAATLLAASTVTHGDPLMACVLGLVTGGVAAGAVHVAKAKARLASSFFTLGFATPVLSVLEDFAALIATATAILMPLFAALVVLGFFSLILGSLLLYRHSRSLAGPVARGSGPAVSL